MDARAGTFRNHLNSASFASRVAARYTKSLERRNSAGVSDDYEWRKHNVCFASHIAHPDVTERFVVRVKNHHATQPDVDGEDVRRVRRSRVYGNELQKIFTRVQSTKTTRVQG
jgi:hypothetical protein